MADFVGLKWKDSFGVTQRTKFRWHTQELKDRIGTSSAIALQKAGLEVRRYTQRTMVGGSTPAGRSPLSKPRWWRVGEKNGYPVIAYVKKIPRPERVSSWAPRAFLRNDVQSDYDPSTKSVVIGPSKFPWLNQLHEVGGSVRVYVRHGEFPVKKFGGHDVPRKHQKLVTYSVSGKGGKRKSVQRYDGAYVGIFSNQSGRFGVGRRTVKDRRYMEIGLIRSMKKIPEQFRDMITYGKIRVFQEKKFRS